MATPGTALPALSDTNTAKSFCSTLAEYSRSRLPVPSLTDSACRATVRRTRAVAAACAAPSMRAWISTPSRPLSAGPATYSARARPSLPVSTRPACRR
ncbi:hypothetical protein D3C72_1229450 [compost metagenome]